MESNHLGKATGGRALRSQRVVKSLTVAAETLIPLHGASKYRAESSTNPGTTVTFPQEKSILGALQNYNSTSWL